MTATVSEGHQGDHPKHEGRPKISNNSSDGAATGQRSLSSWLT